MKYWGYKKGIIRVIAAILAVSMVLSNETSVCGVVFASYGLGGGGSALTDSAEQDEPSVSYDSEINIHTQIKSIQNPNEGSPVQAESSENIPYAVFSVSSMLPAVTVTLNNEGITGTKAFDGENGGNKDVGSNNSGGDENGSDGKDNTGDGDETGTDVGKDNTGGEDGDETGTGDGNGENNGGEDGDETGNGENNSGEDGEEDGDETGTEDEEGAAGDKDDVENKKVADKEEKGKEIALTAEEAEEDVTEGECGAQGDNLTWSYDTDTETLTIRGAGAMKNNYNATNNPAPWLDLSVKHLVIEEGVTSIGQYAFYNCAELEGEIVLPTTLTAIANYAFAECGSGITKIHFQDGGSSRTLTIGNNAFVNCEIEEVNIPASLGEHITVSMGFQYMSSVKKIIVEEGIKQIDRYAIPIANLVEIHLPESLENISDNLFYNAANLARVNPTDDCSVNIPGNVQRIGNYAFQNCYALGGDDGIVCIPESVTVIGLGAFAQDNGNGALKTVIFADGEGEIRSLDLARFAFSNCTNLQEIHFPNNLKSLTANSEAYKDCTSLTKLTIPASLGPDITTAMGFQGMTSVTNLTIEDGIKTVAAGAFYRFQLEEVYLSKDLTTIPNDFFSGATHLVCVNPTPGCNVNIPENVTKIGNNAFYNCPALSGEVRIPAGVTEIGSGAFNLDSAITGITFADGGEDRSLFFGANAFNSCTNLQEIHFPNNLKSLKTNGNVYASCTSLKELTIPGSLRDSDGDPRITREMGFWSMPNVEILRIGEGIENIDSGYNDSEKSLPKVTSLVEVWLPGTLKEISPYLFREAKNLVGINPTPDCNVNIPESVEKIGNNAFYNCYALEGKVCIPAGVTEIGNAAFSSSNSTATNKITEIVFAENEEESRALIFGASAFSNCASLQEIHFPNNLKSLKTNGNVYSGSTSLKELTIPGSLRDSDGNPRITREMGFWSMPNVEILRIEEGIEVIDSGYNDNEKSLPKVTSLVEVRLPGTLEEISPYLFYEAKNLARINPTPDCKVNIPEGVKKIRNNAFQGCTALAGEVCLPVTLEDIGGNAFYNAGAITDITFAEGGENRSLTFGTFAFSNCKNLQEIHFPDTLTSMAAPTSAYSSCTSLKKLTIPGSLRDSDGKPRITPEMGFQGMKFVEELRIKEGIKEIADGYESDDRSPLPRNKDALVEVWLPETLEAIPPYLFYNAQKLARINPVEGGCQVNIPAGVEKIGNRAFSSCTALAGEVRFPVTLEDIGDNAFYNAGAITDITFAEGGENRSLTFAANTFGNCKNLQEIHFPDNLTSMTAPASAYYNCTSLKKLTIPGSLRDSDGKPRITPAMGFQGMTYVEELRIKEGIKEIADGNDHDDQSPLPRNKDHLEEVWLPETLEAIPPYLFYNARKLARINPVEGGCQVNIPEGVKKIGNYAFYYCHALAGEVRIPTGVTEIGNSAFYDAHEITGITFADGGGNRSLTFGTNTFNYCTKLEEIHFPDTLTSMTAPTSAYLNCKALKEVTIPGSLVHLTPEMGFQGMTYVEILRIEEGIEDIIGAEGDSQNSLPREHLEEVWLPETLKKISPQLFRRAYSLARINPTDDGSVNIPEGVKVIGQSAFENCTALAGELHLPSNLTSIEDWAFYNCGKLTGDLRIPAGVTQIGRYAFEYCKGLGPELYLPDGYCSIGYDAFHDSSRGLMSSLHTGLVPCNPGNYCFPGYGYNTRYNTINTIWYRGLDDRDTAEADGVTVGWENFFNYSHFKSATNIKLYIDDTVNHLTSTSYWGRFSDVTFVGENVVTLEKTDGNNIFSKMPEPFNELEGTYYVSKEGALYALNATAGTAALAYCPPGVTSLYIPSTITATADMVAKDDSQYARTYRVTGIMPHAVAAATDLESVTAVNPGQITLGTRAFADCPTLSRVNGVTTQKEANALFGANGTPAIKKAFVNTGLDENDDEISGRGNPMRSLTYINPNVGKLTIDIRKTGGKPDYQDDAYRLLTGQGVAFDLKAEAYGTGNLTALFRVYFEPAALDFTGIQEGKQTITVESNGTTYDTEVKTVYDRITGCYCLSFSLPAGATWEKSGIAGTDAETVTYPAGTPGDELCVWGEVLDFTDAGIDDKDDEVFGGFTGDVNYMTAVWGTKRNLYELYPQDRDNKVQINSNTHKPYFNGQHYNSSPQIKYRDGILINDGKVNGKDIGIGKDPVTAIGYHYTVTLPDGMTWADEEAILKKVNIKGEVISISEDGRTLVYEFTQTRTDKNCYIQANNYLSNLNFGFSYNADTCIVIGEDYDFYHNLGQRIEYKYRATFYYTYSEPDVTQEVTGYENLIAADAGMVELSRRYAFDKDERGNEKRGRGLPMEISFVAENKGKDPASVALVKVTDEVVYDNGYLYLSAEQMADVILGESKYLEIEKIEITEAVLYQGSSYKSEVSHTATDGGSTVQENLLNTWTNPNPSGKTTLTLTVKWPEGTAAGDAVTGDGTAQGRRPIGLTVKVGSGAEQELTFSDDNKTLAGNIRSALEQNGYVIPTGLYKITWNATDAARAYEVGPYTDLKSYSWTIGSYHATVKPDYLQSHYHQTSDSLSTLGVFERRTDNRPTARAIFTLKDDTGSGTHDVTEGVRDTNYYASSLKMRVTGIDSRTGEEILVQADQSQWICPGVVLSYAVEYQNGNSIDFGDMPFMQTFDKNQCLLAPVNENTGLADKGYDTITFMGSEYYMLKPAEEEQEIKGVWLGSADGDCFYADTVHIAGKAQDNQTQQNAGTQIRWYEKDIKAREDSEGSLKKYRFFSYVLEPAEGQERPSASSVVYANNYKSDNPNFSTRIYVYYDGSYRSESIGKSVISNPEAAGTDEEKVSDLGTTYLGVGTSVTYRLSFDEYWIGDYTLKEGELYDLLPRTYGEFAWKLGDNVEVAYYLKERVARAGEKAAYEKYPLSGGLPADFAKIDTVNAPVRGMGENVEQYRLSFGDFTIPYNRTLYIYVTLTFPEKQDAWDGFADAVDGTLYNTLYYGDRQSSVAHMVAKPAQVFLKTGVYGTDGDPYGYIYANSDEETRIVKYYVVIYNHGKSNLFLNPVHIRIPKGFKLKPPPKYTGYNQEPDWNLTDVSVLDAEPPANISRHRIFGVHVTYPAENEACLDIVPYAYYYRWEVYDDLVGKYFLRPGEYVAMEVRFEIEGYQDTEDAAELPAAMEIADPYKVGRITQVQGVDAHRSSYANSNEGTPEFWESDETAEARGFTIEEPTETGKWVASETKMKREEAKPGVTKGAPVRAKAGEGEITYDPQEGVAMEHPVKWECGLMNGGTNSLTDYRVKDSVQWPYVFDGEVKFTSQIQDIYDQKFTITRYTSQVKLDSGETVEKTDRTRLQVNGEEVKIAKSREEAREEGSGCYAEVFYGARVYFYTEDVFGDAGDDLDDEHRHPAETMEIDFTPDKKYGVGPAPSGKRLRSRTLSYWTKFDLSCKNDITRSSYANRIVMEPQQPYTRADVSEGIAIDKDGEPVKNDGDEPAGIMALGYVSVNAGSSTAAWMKVKENKKAGEEDKEPDISGDIAALLTKENKILQGDTGNTVTYTLNVLNHAAGAGIGDTVTNKDSRRYSINNMVIINTMPHAGDKMPFNSKVPRNSDYAVIPADSFNLKLYYYDAEAGGGQGTDIDENKLYKIPEDCYQILYNESTTVASSDWKFIENSAPDWNETVQDSLKVKGWKTEDEFVEAFGDLTYARSFRIEIKEPNADNYDSLADKQDYRSLMKPGRTIVVKYQAKILTDETEDGTKTPTPGQCAWNSFGYRFDRCDGGSAMEASSIRTGVQIPSIPILYEKLIDYNQNPFVNLKEPQTFTFTIDKAAGVDEDGEEHPAQQIRFSVAVGTGQSENNKDLRYITDAASEVTWWKEKADDENTFWEDGASYIVKQVAAPEELPLFSVKVNSQLTNEFVYDALYEPVIVVTNQSRVWNSQLYKMDSRSRGYDPTDDKDKEHILFLPDALFGLYTTDELQRIDLSAITQEKDAERYEWKERYQSVLSGMLEVTYGDDPETAVRLYLKDFSVTDDDGEIIWSGLEDDKYYVRELDAPTGYKPDERFYQITRQYEVLSVYNDRGLKFPITGGTGVLPFYITGAMILSANAALWGERRKRREKTQRKMPAMTPAMMCRIIVRVIQIRRERRAANREK